MADIVNFQDRLDKKTKYFERMDLTAKNGPGDGRSGRKNENNGKGVVAPAKRPHRCGRSSPHGRQNNPLWLISSCHRGRQTNSTLLSCLKSLPVGGAVVTGIGRPALPRWWSWSLCAPLRFGD